MAATIKTSTKCRQRAYFVRRDAERAERNGNCKLALALYAESQELYAKADEYERNARKGIYTKAETERRVKAGKLPPPVDPDSDAPPTETDFYRYGDGSRAW
jgi:hypothetical protein